MIFSQQDETGGLQWPSFERCSNPWLILLFFRSIRLVEAHCPHVLYSSSSKPRSYWTVRWICPHFSTLLHYLWWTSRFLVLTCFIITESFDLVSRSVYLFVCVGWGGGGGRVRGLVFVFVLMIYSAGQKYHWQCLPMSLIQKHYHRVENLSLSNQSLQFSWKTCGRSFLLVVVEWATREGCVWVGGRELYTDSNIGANCVHTESTHPWI